MHERVRKLKAEFNDQLLAQRRMIDAEKEFFTNAKRLEMHRHEDSILAMDESHGDRIRKMKSQEEQYVRQLSQLRSQYLMKKKALIRIFQRDVKHLDSPDTQKDNDWFQGENIADETYANAVVAEILQIRMSNVRSGKIMNHKLRLLAEELEAYIQSV
jgi:hypothetical protein